MVFALSKSFVNPNSARILIIDEPEISLHLEWQKNLIHYIQKINQDIQIIVATHSPGILMEGLLDKGIEIEDIAPSIVMN